MQFVESPSQEHKYHRNTQNPRSPILNSTLTRVTYQQLQTKKNQTMRSSLTNRSPDLKKYSQSFVEITNKVFQKPIDQTTFISQGFTTQSNMKNSEIFPRSESNPKVQLSPRWTQSLNVRDEKTSYEALVEENLRLNRTITQLQDKMIVLENKIVNVNNVNNVSNVSNVSNGNNVNNVNHHKEVRQSFGQSQLKGFIEVIQQPPIQTQQISQVIQDPLKQTKPNISHEQLTQLHRQIKALQSQLYQLTQEFVKFYRQDFKNVIMKPFQQLSNKFVEIIGQNEKNMNTKKQMVEDIQSLFEMQNEFVKLKFSKMQEGLNLACQDENKFLVDQGYQAVEDLLVKQEDLLVNQEHLIDLIIKIRDDKGLLADIPRKSFYHCNDIGILKND